MKNFLSNLWFDWLVLTLIYLLTFVGSGTIASPFHLFNPSIGLFVPVALGNLAGIFDYPKNPYVGIYVAFVFISSLLLGNILGRRYIKNNYLKILFNLIILFILTFLVDMIIWYHWESWQLFAQSVFDVSKGTIDISTF